MISKNSKAWAALSYIGALVIFPLITKQDDNFVLFHAKQGIVLVFFGIGFSVIANISFEVGALPITIGVWVVSLIFSIIGIANCVRGKETKLPIIGNLANKIQL
ncbi:MAG: DUF4870 domain-containing protein [Candidatus Moraniibacteriota bacterium]|nr:MAG: DUF4870 domain-containing protein [Candidatus Moranbacteria bacterium]